MTIILPQPNQRPRPPATVLQGPADADAFRVKVGRYGDRWYTDSLPGCDIASASEWVGPSVSQVKKAKPFEGADFVALKRAALRMTAGDYKLDTSTTYEDLYDRLKSINKLGLQAAGQRGTHVHKMAEQMLYGLPVTEDGPGAHYRGALEDFFAAYQPELVGAEIVFMHRDLHGHGYGGTGDAIIRIEGQTALIDWKSRGEDVDHAAYPEEGAQVAAYATAQYAIAAGTESAHRIPVPQLNVGLIVSIKPDGCRVYPVDLDKAARLWESLHAWWVARLGEKEPIGRPWPTKRALTTPDLPAEILDLGDPKKLPTVAQAGKAFEALKAYKVPEVNDAPRWTATPADESERLTDTKLVARIKAGYARRPATAQAVIDSIMKDAQRAGVPFGQLDANPTVRRFELARTVFAIADHVDGDEELTRAALAVVMGDKPEVNTAPLGALVGSLTPDEARQLARVLEDVGSGDRVADYSSGKARLKSAA